MSQHEPIGITQPLAAIAGATGATRLTRGRIAEVAEDRRAQAPGGFVLRDHPPQLRVFERPAAFELGRL